MVDIRLSRVKKVRGTPEERFWAKVHKSESCWIWMASVGRKGYGLFNRGTSATTGKCVLAHRFSFEMHHDTILAPDQCVLHLCDTPACVRPDHLTTGTKAENNHDMKAKGRSCAGVRSHWFRHANWKIRAIRASSEPATVLANRLAMSPRTVRRVRQGIRQEFPGA